VSPSARALAGSLLLLASSGMAAWAAGGPWLLLASSGLAVRAAAREPSPAVYRWQLPLGFPEPPVPAENPMSQAKVELGRHLFYDVRLSGPGNYACASCHEQARAFSDGRDRAVGATGEIHPRSALSLANVAYGVRFGWADPTLTSLEQQAWVPLLNEAPVEMGLAGRREEVERRLAATDLYPPLFAAAFPGEPAPVRIDNAVRALAAFERTLISGNSAYDRRLFRDERDALSEPAQRGMRLFFSEALGCARCHAGIPLSGPAARRGAPVPEPLFHNTGLHDLGRGRYPEGNEGLYRFTRRGADMGRFRAPTLRNIAVTAPYMHDGSLATLEQVIDHYAAGGRTANPYKSAELRGFAISAPQRDELLAFLRALTDESFLSDPRFASPFAGRAARPAARAQGPAPPPATPGDSAD
jgi:cytochrome c peroxidase